MNHFAKQLKAKQRSLNLSAAALAKTLDVGYNSLCLMLKGNSVPNATTIQKYATFMEMTPERILELAGSKRAAANVAAAATKAVKSVKPVKPAKQKGKVKAPAAKASRATAQAPALFRRAPLAAVDTTTITVAQMTAVMQDVLAMAVHSASETKRAFVAALLNA